ncbi:hypothetical protein C7S20_05530 [Christiangramia fulva]|uniref:Uncharacterized protein n=1 Tax=Christiangramia fulva TaxID=2126553 RepID=A0A2R3Z3D9_9FLAO|nr:hypothetical protein [Christiangramia fulva]AVR44769.1 hypothetical protein C7S20_05530 [Christiangramia fulva]
MAIIKFENTHDLIDYLCQKEVLGELKVKFWLGNGWESEFNFDYPDLEKHLNLQLFIHFLDCIWMVNKVEVDFESVEDYSTYGEWSGMEMEDKSYIEQILSFIRESVEEATPINDVYTHIDIEENGDSYKLSNIEVKRFEIFQWDDGQKSIPIDQELRLEHFLLL